MASDLVYYSLDNQINTFFRTYTSVTREQCDKYAASVAGEPVTPESIQGMWSYTVTAGTKRSIVQFRAPSSSLDMKLLALARDTHGTVVANCVYYGTIGLSMPLPVYVMEKLPGVPYIQVQPSPGPGRPMSPAAASRVINTVTDFARFFASSWRNPQVMETSAIGTLLTEYQQRLSLLAEALPSRFAEKLSLVGAELPSLFSSPYPLVLSHGDLCEMNILVDHLTGHITGVIDWEDARILPFGFSLWGFENVLGHMDSEGWHYYDNRDSLVSLFWQAFDREVGSVSDRRAIAVARSVGIFCRYGFAWAKGPWVPVDESNYSMKYLDAFFNTSV
ncbi:hypothetical protein CEP52_016814 [Fusarium oligoseptatum]|uniref:Aminoglycoside phosphotransferase domain-containing protein n=1 Tax=Fusarium oligoseptatum TaxID=2604345 RepID=A0A428RZQ5_9HYPO|nr:hypothetical protein CEP52_016814 [Fusarium oligoseptatum]